MTKWKKLLPASVLLLGFAFLLFAKLLNVDIKPGSSPNCMDRDSNGLVAVAIDDPASCTTGTIELNNEPNCTTTTAVPVRCTVEDVPGFGDSTDCVCHFKSSDLRTAGVMPTTGNCKTVYVCVSNFVQGFDSLCDAHSATCS